MLRKLFALLLVSAALPCGAQQPEEAINAVPEANLLELGTTVSDMDLDANRGRFTLHLNNMELDGRLYDNSISGSTVVTGSNAVSSDAFAGSSGLSTVIQNSGNNVIIQNATILNLNVK